MAVEFSPQPPSQMGIPEGSLGELLSAEQPASLPLPLCFPGTVVRGQGYSCPAGATAGGCTLPSPEALALCFSPAVLALGALTALLRRLISFPHGQEVVAQEGQHLQQEVDPDPLHLS